MDPILAVVRGDAPVSSVKGSAAADPARPSLADLAAGILRYANRKRGRKGWAEFLIRSDLVELQPCEASPDWDVILSAVWDASSGAPLDPAAIGAARRIAASDVIPS